MIEPEDRPMVVAVGTAHPPDSYSQVEVLDAFGITDARIRSLFLSGSIERRGLYLPPVGPDGRRTVESQGELLEKHRHRGIELGVEALLDCLKDADAEPSDIGYLCCVTSTGWLTPGFSALISRELGLSLQCGRLDVVGMGCNAGLNGLGAVAGWAATHPGQLAVLLCVEVCSAAYVFDNTMRSAVVNSLFGDGAAAAAVMAPPTGQRIGPALLRTRSCLIPEAIEAMRYDWDEDCGKFSFFLDRDIPYVVGAHVEATVGGLLDGTGVGRRDVAHWTIHSGGKKVIDAVKVNLGLTRHDVRHTMSVLREWGNLSSASFLFSYRRLLDEGVVEPGDHGVWMTMGPGSTIETALLRW
jgi:3,5-dihydroxyphenylacetyl-CoA synthase